MLINTKLDSFKTKIKLLRIHNLQIGVHEIFIEI